MGQQRRCGWYTRFDCKRICKDWWYFPWWFVKTTRWDVQVICRVLPILKWLSKEENQQKVAGALEVMAKVW